MKKKLRTCYVVLCHEYYSERRRMAGMFVATVKCVKCLEPYKKTPKNIRRGQAHYSRMYSPGIISAKTRQAHYFDFEKWGALTRGMARERAMECAENLGCALWFDRNLVLTKPVSVYEPAYVTTLHPSVRH